MGELNDIALRYGTDKSSAGHGYCDIYESYFSKLRNEKINLLETGIGGFSHEDGKGYDRNDKGGESLKMWAEYFPKGKITGIDIFNKSFLNHGRIWTYQGSQDDAMFLNGIILGIGHPDIIIDDASHINPLTIASFEILFPLLKPGGIYVIEDVHTSYWDNITYKGTKDLKGDSRSSVMNYFKNECDALNLDLPNSGVNPIKAIHFYKKLIVILKHE